MTKWKRQTWKQVLILALYHHKIHLILISIFVLNKNLYNVNSIPISIFIGNLDFFILLCFYDEMFIKNIIFLYQT